MSFSGSSPFYFNRGVGVGGSVPNSGPLFRSSPQSVLSTPPGFKNFSNPNVGFAQPLENPSPGFGHGNNMGTPSTGSSGEKKKRGRPKKHGPDGANVSLALSSDPSPSSQADKKSKGRPKGSGRKQRLSSLGDWMNSSAGTAFTPHVIHIAAGEDIASKILLFAQQKRRALCILSANGSVSTVTLRQPGSSHESVTFEGRFQISCLSGSYLLSEEGGPRNRTGGLCISFSSPDGHTRGGAIGGRLIAASLVQVIVCSFLYGDHKRKNNPEADADADLKADHDSDAQPTEKPSTPHTSGPSENVTTTSGMAGWPPTSIQPGTRDPSIEIDLARG